MNVLFNIRRKFKLIKFCDQIYPRAASYPSFVPPTAFWPRVRILDESPLFYSRVSNKFYTTGLDNAFMGPFQSFGYVKTTGPLLMTKKTYLFVQFYSSYSPFRGVRQYLHKACVDPHPSLDINPSMFN